MRTIVVAVTLAALGVSAQAQTQHCADRTTVTERLTSGYGEEFAGGGLRNAESIFEVWMSDESGTWTILMTNADGTSCVMAAGTNWRKAGPVNKRPVGVPG